MLEKASQISRIDQIVTNTLPKQARDHCVVGGFKNGELCLIVENGSWSTAIRYQQNNLMNKLQAHPELKALQKITIKTRPPSAPLLAARDIKTKRSDRGIPSVANESNAANQAKETGQFKQIKDPDLRKIMRQLSKAIQQ